MAVREARDWFAVQLEVGMLAKWSEGHMSFVGAWAGPLTMRVFVCFLFSS
jgi:hypothetical protein